MCRYSSTYVLIYVMTAVGPALKSKTFALAKVMVV